MEELQSVKEPHDYVTMKEIEIFLESMKSNEATGPSRLGSYIRKSGGKVVLELLTKVLQHIMGSEESSAEWKDSVTVPLFKEEGDPLQCGKYRALRLLEHRLKVWEKIFDRRLKAFVNVNSNQFGLSARTATTDAIFILQRMRQKYFEKKKQVYFVFMELENTFSPVPIWTLRWALRKKRSMRN